MSGINLKNNKRVISLLLLTVVMAFCCIFGVISLQKNGKPETASANAVGETINLENTDGTFSRGALNTLFKKISGNDTLNYLEFESAYSESAAGLVLKKATDINANVKLGGLIWNVVALTKTDEGMVATLWLGGSKVGSLHNSNKTAQYSGGDLQKAAVAYKCSDGTTKIADKYKDYLVAPSKIGWQATGDGIENGTTGYIYPNEFYDMPTDKLDDKVKDNHTTAWKDDLLWIPSISETYSPGIWGVSTLMRANSEAEEMYERYDTLLRSGSDTAANFASYLNCDGRNFSTGLPVAMGGAAVRPALHLNLKAATASVTDNIPVQVNGETEMDYGENQTLTLKNADGTEYTGGGDIKWVITGGTASFSDTETVTEIISESATLYATKANEVTVKAYVSNDSGTGSAEFKVTVNKAVLTPASTIEGKIYDGTTDGTGTITLSGAAWDEEPTATATFTWASADAGTTTYSVTEITLGEGWDVNYELSVTELSGQTNEYAPDPDNSSVLESVKISEKSVETMSDVAFDAENAEGFTISEDNKTASIIAPEEQLSITTGAIDEHLEVVCPEGITREGDTFILDAGLAAGDYVITFAPAENYAWADGSTGEKTLTVRIYAPDVTFNVTEGFTLTAKNTVMTNSSDAAHAITTSAIDANVTVTLPEGITRGEENTNEFTLSAGLAAGEYIIRLKPNTGYYWSDGSDEERTLTIKVMPADTIILDNADATGFLEESLNKLVGKIVSGASTYADVYSGLTENKTAADINTTVVLGGLEWYVVYASKDNSGDVIATLWLTESSVKTKFSLNKKGQYVGSEAQKFALAYTCVDGTTKIAEKYADYLVTPANVSWQKNGDGFENGTTNYDYANEFYDMPTDKMIAAIKSLYNPAWKDDLLWLPSASEVGGKLNAGDPDLNIWGVSTAQKANAANLNSWLRSSCHDNSEGAWTCLADGTFKGSHVTNYEGAIRPALHLNLRVAFGDICPDVTFDAENAGGFTLSEDGKLATIVGTADSLTITATAIDEHVDVTLPAGVEQSGSTFTLATPVTGDYIIKFKPQEGYLWPDGGSEERQLTIRIYAPDVTFDAENSEGFTLSEDGKLATIVATSDALTITATAIDEHVDVTLPAGVEQNGNAFTLAAPVTGDYVIKLKPQEGYFWQDGGSEERTLTIRIYCPDVAFDAENAEGFTLSEDGKLATIVASTDSLTIATGAIDANIDVVCPEGITRGEGNSNEFTLDAGLAAGDYVITFAPAENYAWADGSTGEKTLTVRIYAPDVTFNVTEGFTLTAKNTVMTNSSDAAHAITTSAIDANVTVTLPEGITRGEENTNEFTLSAGLAAGEYIIRLKPNTGYYWSDGSDEERTLTIKVMPADTIILDSIDGKGFDEAALDALMQKIQPGVMSYDDLSSNFKGNKNAANIKATVVFGGLKWYVVYASKDNSGNVIATLYLTGSSVTSKFNTDQTSKYSGGQAQKAAVAYKGSDGAKIADKYAAYIVKPANVSWQANGNSFNVSGNKNYDLPNEFYNISTNQMQSTQASWHTTAWKNDLLWLPSISEVGGRNGLHIFGLSTDQIKNDAFSGDTWLRSGHYEYSEGNIKCIGSSGSLNFAKSWTHDFAVRPALHLNLKAATASVNDDIAVQINGNTEMTYGENQTLTLKNSDGTDYTGDGIKWVILGGTASFGDTEGAEAVTEITGTNSVTLYGTKANEVTVKAYVTTESGAGSAEFTVNVKHKALATTPDVPVFNPGDANGFTISDDNKTASIIASTEQLSITTGAIDEHLEVSCPEGVTREDNTFTLPENAAGEYVITFAPEENYCWADESTEEKTLTIRVSCADVSFNATAGFTPTAKNTVMTNSSASARTITTTRIDANINVVCPNGITRGSENTDEFTLSANIAKGDYIIRLTPKSGCFWSDGGTEERQLTIKVTAAETILLENAEGTGFSKLGLDALMDKIRQGTVSYEDLSDNFGDNKQFETINATVVLGGLEWYVVYASKDNSGNVIATLWLKESSVKSVYNSNSKAQYSGGELQQAAVAYKCSDGTTKIAEKYASYIVTPAKVSWQANRNDIIDGDKTKNYDCPNEFYDMPTDKLGSTVSGNHTTAWKDDLLWIPSKSEIGAPISSDIWGCIIATHKLNGTDTWLRSGYTYGTGNAYCLHADGTYSNSDRVTNSYAVRPALHLNLKTATDSINGNIVVQVNGETEMDYGENQTLTLQNSDGIDYTANDNIKWVITGGTASFSNTETVTEIISASATLYATKANEEVTVKAYVSNDSGTGSAEFKVTVNKAVLTPVSTIEGKIYDGTTDGTGTITLSGAAWDEEPTATATFTWASADAGTTTYSVTEITLGEGWDVNYELSVTELSGQTNEYAPDPDNPSVLESVKISEKSIETTPDVPVFNADEAGKFTVSEDKLTATVVATTDSLTITTGAIDEHLEVTCPEGITRSSENANEFTLSAGLATGDYIIKFVPADNYCWADGSTGEKTLTIRVYCADVSFNATAGFTLTDKNTVMTNYSNAARTITTSAIDANIEVVCPAGITRGEENTNAFTLSAGLSAGEYIIRLKPNTGYYWPDGSDEERTLTIKVRSADIIILDNADGTSFSKLGLDALMQKIQPDVISYDDLSDNFAGNKNVTEIGTTVILGGLEWYVVYASKDNSGNVIATLWLKESSQTSVYNSNGKAQYSGGELQKAAVAFTCADGTTKIAEKYADYLVTPANISWQKNGDGIENGTDGYVYPNEYYDMPTDKLNSKGSGNHTTAWKDDPLWIPSMSETGGIDSINIWGLTAAQRSNGIHTWLRSGGNGDVNSSACVLNYVGVNYAGYVKSDFAVRPALHLNLNAASAAAVTDDIAVEINGNAEMIFGESQTLSIKDYVAGNAVKWVITGGTASFAPVSEGAEAVTAATGESVTLYGIKANDVTVKAYVSNDVGAGSVETTITVKNKPLATDPELPLFNADEAGKFTVSEDKLTATIIAPEEQVSITTGAIDEHLEVICPEGVTREDTTFTLSAGLAAGDYLITFAPAENYCWADGSTGEKTLTIRLYCADVTINESDGVTLSEDKKTATMVVMTEFTVTEIDEHINVSCPGGITRDGNTFTVSANAAAGDYKITLKPNTGCYWPEGGDEERYLIVKVTKIELVLSDDTKIMYSSEVMQSYRTLISAISQAAGKGATEDYDTLVSNLESANIKSDNGATIGGNKFKGYVVKFGGYTWHIVNATRDTSGNAIVTLWLSDVGTNAGLYTDSKAAFTDFEKNDRNMTYVSNVYGTSKVRACLIGANYSPDGSNLKWQGQHDVWTRFTTDSQLGKYLVQPNYIKYQEWETPIGEQYFHLNDAYTYRPDGNYGTTSHTWPYSNGSVQSKSHYYDWRWDKIWLPSYSEVKGNNDNGWWNIDSSIRNYSTDEDCWLRSGFASGLGRAYYLNHNGAANVDLTNSRQMHIRPAIHLNLKAAFNAADDDVFTTIKGEDMTYDEEQTLSLNDYHGDGEVTWEIENGTGIATFEKGAETLTFTGATPTIYAAQAGTVTVKATVTAEDNGKTLTDTNTLTINIKKKVLTPTSTIDGKTYDGTTDGTGSISLSGAIEGESPTATATFTWTDKNAETTTYNVTNITLEGEWGTNYELSVTELKNQSNEYVPEKDPDPTDPTDPTEPTEPTEPAVTEYVKISKRTIQPIPIIDAKTYDGTTDGTGTIWFEGAVDGEQPTAVATWRWTDATAETTTYNVTQITFESDWDRNYVLSTDEILNHTNDGVKISKVVLTPTSTIEDKVYDGTTDGTGTLIIDIVSPGTNSPIGDDLPTISGTFNWTSKNAGTTTYNVTNITLDGDWGTNYELSVTELSEQTYEYAPDPDDPMDTVSATISKRVLTIEWADTTVNYDGEEHKPAVTLGNFTEGEGSSSVTVTLSGEGESDKLGVNVGSYTATITEWAGNDVTDINNYALPEDISTTLTIEKTDIGDLPLFKEASTVGFTIKDDGKTATAVESKLMEDGELITDGIDARLDVRIVSKFNSVITRSGDRFIVPRDVVAGDYKIIFAPKTGYTWADGGEEERELLIRIYVPFVTFIPAEGVILSKNNTMATIKYSPDGFSLTTTHINEYLSIYSYPLTISSRGLFVYSATGKIYNGYISLEPPDVLFWEDGSSGERFLDVAVVHDDAIILDNADCTGFDKEGVAALFGAIGGSGKNTYDAMSGALGEATGAILKNSKTINKKVVLDGLVWHVAAVSKTAEGDVVATLWLVEDLRTPGVDWQQFEWNDWEAGGEAQYDYPSNMYSSSKARAYLMGTDYTAEQGVAPVAGNGASLRNGYLAAIEQKYGSLIVAPSEIAWQGVNYSIHQGNRADYRNESWNENYRIDSSYEDYFEKPGYTDWKNDKFWLPSAAEVYTYRGLWGFDTKEVTSRFDSLDKLLLRSAVNYNESEVLVLVKDGELKSKGATVLNGILRPAFHLNLKALDEMVNGISPSITAEKAEMAYGEEQTLTLTGNDGNGEVTWTIESGSAEFVGEATGESVVIKATGVGEITVKAEVAASGNYAAVETEKTITVVKAEISPTIKANTGIKNGEEQKLSIEGNLGEASVVWSITSYGGDASFMKDVTAQKSFASEPTLYAHGDGQIELKATISESENYKGAEVAVLIVISADGATVKPEINYSSAMTFGGEQKLSITNNQSTGAVTWEVVDGTGSATFEDGNTTFTGAKATLKATGAGTVTVKATIAADGGYEAIALDEVTITVSAAEVALEWGDVSYEYTGSEIEITAPTVTLNGETVELGITLSYDGDRTNVGSFTVTAAFTDDQTNYVLPETVTQTITITPKAVSEIVWSGNGEIVYDGESHVPAAKFTGADGNEITLEVSGEAALNVGSYEYTADVSGQTNYDFSSATTTATIEITKAQVSVSKFVVGETEIASDGTTEIGYTGENLYPVAYFTFNGTDYEIPAESVTVKAGAADGDTVSEVINVNTYYVTVSAAVSDNFDIQASDAAYSFAITVASISPEITAEKPETVYGEEQTLTLSGNGDGEVTWTIESGSAEFVGEATGASVTLKVTGVGTVTVKASVAESGNYAAGSAEVTITVTQAAITPEITVEKTETAYGEEQTLTLSGNGDGEVSWSIESGSAEFVGEATGASVTLKVTGVGSVTVKASVAASGNYAAGSAEATITVVKAAITPTIKVDGGMKNGTSQKLSIEGNLGEADAVWTITSYGGSASFMKDVTAQKSFESEPTLYAHGVGQIELKVTVAESENYKGGEAVIFIVITHEATKPEITAEKSEMTFGTSQTLSVIGYTGSGEISWTIESGSAEFVGEATGASVTLKATGVGEVKVKAEIAADGGYEAIALDEVTITVSAAEVALDWGEVSYEYTGSEIEVTAPTVTLNGEAVELGITLSYDGDRTNVGSFTVTAAFTDDQTNYVLPELVTQTITITPKAVSEIVWSSNGEIVYDGESHVPAAKFTGADGSEITLEVSGEAALNVGSYDYTADVSGQTNYDFSSATATATIEITKAQVSVSKFVVGETEIASDGSTEIGYTGENLYPVAYFTFNGTDYEILAGSVIVKAGAADGETVSEVINVNTYFVTISAAVSDNFDIQASDAAYSFAITVASISPSITAEKPETVYGEEQTLTLTGNGDGEVSWTIESGSAEFVGEATGASVTLKVTGVGTVTVKASVAESGNYAAGSAEVTITVAQATITPEITVEKSETAYGEEQTLTLTGNGDGEVTWTIESGNAEFVGEATGASVTLKVTGVGTVTVKASVAASGNYAAGSAEATITVVKAAITPTIKVDGGMKNGTSQKLSIEGNLGEADAVWTITSYGGNASFMKDVTAQKSFESEPTLYAHGVGQIELKVTVAESENYKGGEAVIFIVITHEATKPEITAEKSEMTFGTSQTLSVIGYTGSGEISWTIESGSAEFVGEATGASVTLKATGVGEVKVKATIAADGGYEAIALDEVTITVSAAEVALDWGEVSYEYTGSEIEVTAPTVTLNGEAVELGITLSYDGDRTNVGSFTVTAAFTDDQTNYVLPETVTQTITITKAAITPTIKVENTEMKNGTSQKLSIEGNLGDADLVWTIASLGGDASFLEAVTVEKTLESEPTLYAHGVGQIELKVTVAESENYEAGEVKVLIVITADGVTVKPVISYTNEFTYGGEQTLSVANNPSTGEITWTIVNGTGSATFADGGNTATGATPTLKATGAGTVTLKAEIAADENNGAITLADVTITIARAAITPAINADDTEMVYGASQELSVEGNLGNASVVWTITGVGGSASFDGSVTVEKSFSATPTLYAHGVGMVELKATVAESKNYEGGETIVFIVITRAAITPAITADKAEMTFGTSQNLSVNGNTGNGEITWTIVNGTGSASFKDGATVLKTTGAVPELFATGAGTVTVKASIAANGNYNAATAEEVTITITPAALKPVIVCDEDMIYGQSQQLSVNGNYGNGGVTWTVVSGSAEFVGGNTGESVTLKATCVGSVTVKAEVAANGNYAAGEVTATLTVNAKEIAVDWTETSFTYDGNAHLPIATLKADGEEYVLSAISLGEAKEITLSNGEVINVTVALVPGSSSDMTSVGSYGLSMTIEGDGYAVSTATKNVTVSIRPVQNGDNNNTGNASAIDWKIVIIVAIAAGAVIIAALIIALIVRKASSKVVRVPFKDKDGFSDVVEGSDKEKK